MITIYRREEDGTLVGKESVLLSQEAVWVDVRRPSKEEIDAICGTYQVRLPTPEAMRRLEASDALHGDDDTQYMTIATVSHPDGQRPMRGYMTFILTPKRLITVHHTLTEPFAWLVPELERDPKLSATPGVLLVWLNDTLVERVSTMMERLEHEIDLLSAETFEDGGRKHRLFDRNTRYRAMLRLIGRKASTLGKARQSLHSILRLLNYLQHLPAQFVGDEHCERCRVLQEDIKGLLDHANQLTQSTTFLLDAALGFISIDQNMVMKFFTVVSVLFMPPTLIGTVYGMNFEFMPELHWPWGYPLALIGMVCSGLLPFLYSRRKGWL